MSTNENHPGWTLEYCGRSFPLAGSPTTDGPELTIWLAGVLVDPTGVPGLRAHDRIGVRLPLSGGTTGIRLIGPDGLAVDPDTHPWPEWPRGRGHPDYRGDHPYPARGRPRVAPAS